MSWILVVVCAILVVVVVVGIGLLVASSTDSAGACSNQHWFGVNATAFPTNAENDVKATLVCCGTRMFDLHPRCITRSSYITTLGTENAVGTKWSAWVDYIDWDKERRLQRANLRPLLFLRTGSHSDPLVSDVSALPRILARCTGIVDVVTGDGDQDGTLDRYQRMQHPRLGTWWTQNLHAHHHDQKNIRAVPIGFDLHSRGPPRELVWAQMNQVMPLPPSDRTLNVFCDAHLSITHNDRCRMYDAWKDQPWLHALSTRCSYQTLWNTYYARYRFVVSPRGNGIDCHRTWEALWLGAIVITRSSSIDSLFEGLPVICLDDWSPVPSRFDLQTWAARWSQPNALEGTRSRILALFTCAQDSVAL